TLRRTSSRPLLQVCIMSCIRGSSHTACINLVTQQYPTLDRRLAALASSFHEGVDAVATDSNRARMPRVGRGDTTVEVTADGASSRRGGCAPPRRLQRRPSRRATPALLRPAGRELSPRVTV